MKHVITGSLGNISRPLAEKLVQAGHHVTIISNDPNKVNEIRAMGAHPAIGNVEDRVFLIKAFEGADGAYLMIPPNPDWKRFQKIVADNYLAAVQRAGIKHIVMLSSLGAHIGSGVGPVDGMSYLEKQLAGLNDVAVRVLRAGYFYSNLFVQMSPGTLGSTQPADFKPVWAHTDDIADVAAAYLADSTFTGFTYEAVVSDDTLTWEEIAQLLGLTYVQLTDTEFREGMLRAGLPPTIADAFVALGKAMREGRMYEEYWKNPPHTLGKIKLRDALKALA